MSSHFVQPPRTDRPPLPEGERTLDGEASIGFAGESTLDLLARIRVGDRAARDALCRRLYPRLTRFAHSQLPPQARDLKETGDLVNEALFKTFSNLDSFEHRHQGSLFGYLCRGVRNQINDEIRRVSRHPPREVMAGSVIDHRPSPVELAIGREQHELYERALAQLSDTDREAIFLSLELDLSNREIAEALGKPSADAARMTVNRAVLRLGRLLERAGV